MRGTLLVATLLAAVMFSGCLVDDDGSTPSGNNGMDSQQGSIEDVSAEDSTLGEGTTIPAGTSLGTLTFEDDGGMNAQGASTDCDSIPVVSLNVGGVGDNRADHPWSISRVSPDGAPWHISSLTVEVVQDPRTATDMDVFIYNNNGDLVGRTEESGPDGIEGTSSVTLHNVAAGPLELTVVNCGGVSVAYTVTGAAAMVASQDYVVGSPAATNNNGNTACNTSPTSNGYVATRTETYTAILSGATGTADLSTGAGHLDYNAGGGDDYKLVADFEARGSTEQQACDRLAEMYVDHTAENGAVVTLDVHGKPGGNGQWNDKKIDLTFDAPAAISWTTFDADTGAGGVSVDGAQGGTVTVDAGAGGAEALNVDATRLSVDAGAGSASIIDSTADSMSVDAGAGGVTIKGSEAGSLSAEAGAGGVVVSNTRADDLDLDAGAGGISASMLASTASGAWDLHAGAGGVTLTVKETSSIGYDVYAHSGAGSVTFSFKDVQETSSDCQYASCTREGKTSGYDTRPVKIDLDMDVGAGGISAGS